MAIPRLTILSAVIFFIIIIKVDDMTREEQLKEAQEMRGNIIEAIRALTKRGAKSWNIGGQSYTSMDVSDLLKMLQYWDNVISNLTGGRRTIRRVIPVDD
jgi:hypothetical protein